ncbi:right-handed parallel beta-helix repeat-containing protein [Bradyrhizobium sp. USDA 3311]
MLVKDQADQTTNGIYAVSTGSWVRTGDAQSNTQFFQGMAVCVAVGTINARLIFICTTTDDPVVIGTSLVTFSPFGNTLLNTGFFAPCRVATTGSNIALSALQVIDGVQLAAGDRVLVKDQTSTIQNGIYTASAGAWSRSTDVQPNTSFFPGMAVNVASGNANAEIMYILNSTDDPVVIGTSHISFAPFGVTPALIAIVRKERWLSDVPGVDFTGATDCTALVRQAILGAQAARMPLNIDPGTVLINGAVIDGPCSIFGCGRSESMLQINGATGNGLLINTPSEVQIESLWIRGAPGASAGAGISLAGGASQNLFSTFRDLLVDQCAAGFATTTAADWTIDNCVFNVCTVYSVFVQDTYNPDAGDSQIVSSTLAGAAGSTLIYQASSGGLKITGNKIIGGAYGYRMVLPDNTQTVDLLFTGNSVENQTAGGLQMVRSSSLVGSTFANVAITGNQFAQGLGAVTTLAQIGDVNTGWLFNVAVTGNVFTLSDPHSTALTMNAVSDWVASGNIFFGPTGANSCFGIATLGTSGPGRIGANLFENINTPISNGSVAVFVDPLTQHGSVNITTSTAVGALFSGSITITFSQPFLTVPRLKVVVTDTSSGLSATVGAVTKTQATIFAFGFTNGASVQVLWEAFADA